MVKDCTDDSPARHHRVVVIVLNWNGADVIRDCLASLRRQAFREFAVLVVDNASKDDSRRIVHEEFPEASLLALDENAGFCKGNNRGIEYAWQRFPSVEYIALLNNDTAAQPEWLEALVAALDAHRDCGMAASKMLCWDGESEPETIDTAGDVFFKHGLAGKRGHGEPRDNYSATEQVFAACAGAVLYRSDMLREIGLLDEDFFAYNEDVDLGFRARLAGWSCLFVADAVVWHRVSYTTKPFSDSAIYWSKRNSVWVLVKNWPAKVFIRHLFPVLAYNFLSDVRWLLGGRIKPVLKGRWDALLGIRKMLAKRRKIRQSRKITADELDSWIIRHTPWCETLRRNLKRVCGMRS